MDAREKKTGEEKNALKLRAMRFGGGERGALQTATLSRTEMLSRN